MPSPSPVARADLDTYVQVLAHLGNGLTLDDFRTAQIARAQRTARRVRAYILIASFIFMSLALGVLFVQTQVSIPFKPGLANGDDVTTAIAMTSSYDMTSAAIWALALGGLGAAASIFLHVLKMMPQETLRTSDEFEVVGRLVLGCLFSTILAITLAATEMTNFFKSLHGQGDVKGGVTLLLPFLAGYSIPLVLGLLEKAIRAIELTIGLDDRRAITIEERRDTAARRLSRRSRL